MNYKKLFLLAALCSGTLTHTLHGAWNPSDLRGSFVIGTISANPNQGYEIGECSGIELYETGALPNKTDYQTPYVLYYAAPPLANIQSLFKNNILKIRPVQIQCSTESTEPYFTIELPTTTPNKIKLTKIESLATYVTTLDLEKLQTYLTTKTTYFSPAKILNTYPAADNPWKTLKTTIPQEQSAYVYIDQPKSYTPQIVFIEVSCDLAIDYFPANSKNYGGFGYIAAVNVQHVAIQTKILDVLKYTSANQFISTPKTVLKSFQIPLETLLNENIMRQDLITQ